MTFFVGLQPDSSTSGVSLHPKMAKEQFFCEDSHVTYDFLWDFKKIKDYIGTYNASPFFELYEVNCCSL